jgi:hypothetical protein
MTAERRKLGAASTVAHRRGVFRIAGGLEVDEVGGFEVSRRRLLFAEVRLVTLHRVEQGAAVWVLGGLTAASLVAEYLVGGTSLPGAVTLYAVAGLSACGVVLTSGPAWVVTAYGRRSRLAMRFRRREARARSVYAEVCRSVAEAQAELPEPPPRDLGEGRAGAAEVHERLVGEEPEA